MHYGCQTGSTGELLLLLHLVNPDSLPRVTASTPGLKVP